MACNCVSLQSLPQWKKCIREHSFVCIHCADVWSGLTPQLDVPDAAIAVKPIDLNVFSKSLKEVKERGALLNIIPAVQPFMS